jgi:heme-degrading monooxygenase HmoA
MHAVFFEVRPKPGHLEHYFEHVGRLRPVLARHTGLAFIDRYASLSDREVLLSHQLWDSEEAIVGWRADSVHRQSQTAGQKVHFADYRIRVGARVLHLQSGLPDDPPTGGAEVSGAHVVALYATAPIEVPGFTAFESVNRQSRYVALASIDGVAAAAEVLTAHRTLPGLEDAAAYCIRRDYGQHDRAQAPAPVTPG